MDPHTTGKVVKTKIKPPLRRVGLLRRPRLIDFLHDHVNRKLLLLSASPGYGKTSLLVDFVQDTELPTCWYAMDASDGDPRNFLTYLVACIVETFPSLAGGALGALLESVAPNDELETLVASLVNAIQESITEYFVIIIDDFQFASGSETILELVNWFLDHQPDNCCLILASRVTPDLPYLRLTARQEIAGLGSEDLAFTPDEIQAYLEQNHNLTLPLEEARKLADETEGWITGILLGTHTLWKGLIRSITAAKARDEQVFDYMAQEIFDQQPEPIKRFLKSTAVLSVMTPDFCDRLLGITDSTDTLAALEGANLFTMRLSGDELSYRYHALFQDFLLKQFEPDGRPERAALERQAGQLRLEGGRWEAALEHFLASGADDLAAGLIKEHMEAVFRQGQLVTLVRWLDALDRTTVGDDPALLLMRGRLHRQAGEFERAMDCYGQARVVFAERGDQSGELSVQIHEALLHQYSGSRGKARGMAEEALTGAEAARLDPAMRAQAHRILGEYHQFAGELEAAKREYRHSLELYKQAGDRYHESLLLQALGTTARRMGNPLEAEEHYTRALEILKSLGNRWRMAELQNNIGVGYYYQGEYEKAHEIFERALQDAREVGHTRTTALVLLSMGDLYADLGEVSDAQRHFQNGLDGARRVSDAFLEVYCLCALANLYRVDEAWEHARSLLDQARKRSGEEDSGYLNGLVSLSHGMVAQDQGELDEALDALDDAVDRLTAAGAQRELTRAHLWQADTLFRMDRREQAYGQLARALELSREIKHPHLLVADGSRMGALLERAGAEARIEGLDELLARIQQFNLQTARVRVSEPPSEVKPPVVEARALGTDTVRVDGRTIAHTEWKGPLVKELFFYLLENEPARRELILDAFWPEYSTAKAQSVFHASLYRMRRILPEGLIRYDNSGGVYVVDKSVDHWYDARAFADLYSRADSGAEALDLLDQAVDMYDGEFLPPVYSEWCLSRRGAYHGMYVDALGRLGELYADSGRFDEAQERYRAAVEVEPFQEELHRGLMQVLSDAGRHAEALKHYEWLEELLRAELDIAPAEETQSLYARIQARAQSPG